MINPESEAAKRIKFIHNRLDRAQQVLKGNTGLQTREEIIGRQIVPVDQSAVARSSEAIIDSVRAQVLTRELGIVHDWVGGYAPSFDEMPSIKGLRDGEGRAYRGGGFELVFNVISEPISFSSLTIDEEEALLDPPVSLRFTFYDDNEYGLTLDFKSNEYRKGVRMDKFEYHSGDKVIDEMPEDDAVIVEDLLSRVKNHLGIDGSQANS